MNWYKGNIHTHTNVAGGDASPAEVVKWYRKHGYDFLVLSDHNHLTILEYGETQVEKPIMIPGEEVSVNLEGRTPVHLIAVGITRLVEPIDAGEVVPTLQANIDAILGAGGIASIAHPNFRWAFDHEAINQVTGASMMEVFTPNSNVDGGPGRHTTEEIWDGVLSSGNAIWGVAADDSHDYHDFTPQLDNPGRGWLVVRAERLTSDALVDSMQRGDFYASTGVMLEELEITKEAVSLRIVHENDWLYTSTFVGRGGTVFAQATGPEAIYRIRGDEGYVRAVVTYSNPIKAWTQPVFVP